MEGTALYRPILKRAWNITKKFKGLWFFGLFVVILGTSGSYEIFSRVLSRPTNNPGIISGTVEGLKNGLSGSSFLTFIKGMWEILINDPQTFALMIIILIISIAITIFFIWLSVISQIGIIRNTNEIINGKKPTINDGIDFATGKFWPTLGINVVLRILFFIIFAILGWALVSWSALGLAGTISYYVALGILTIVIFATSFIARAQIYYFAVKKQSIKEALKTALQTLKKNWLVILEITVILFAIYTLTTFIIALVGAMALTFPLILLVYYTIPAWLTGFLSIASLAIAFGAGLFITALVMTFQWSAWILLLKRLDANNGFSGIARGSKKIIDYIKK